MRDFGLTNYIFCSRYVALPTYVMRERLAKNLKQ